MNSQFSDIRKEYKKGKLTRNTISENPFEQFARWLNDALHCGENEPTAMIVATVSPDGRPSTRTVLLKGVENGKLIFFTNYESRKGRQLTANPYISLSFVWHKLERQVHIEGKAEKCTPQESDAYFSTRPYILKGKQRNALLKNRTLTSPPDPTKAGSAQEYPPKVTSSAAGWK